MSIIENGKVNVKLNSLQLAVIESVFDDNFNIKDVLEVGVFGGFGNGKSFVLMLIAHMLATKYPNAKFLFMRTQTTDLEQSVVSQFHNLFPPLESGYRYKIQPKINLYKNGSQILFRGYNMSNWENIRSSEYDSIFMCQAEEVPFLVFKECLGRLRAKALPFHPVFFEGNPADCWVKKRYKVVSNKDLPKKSVFLEAETAVNSANLPDNYIERMKDTYTANEIDRLIYGSWENTNYLIHPAFDEFKHVIPPQDILPEWEQAIGFDHGMVNASCLLWGAKDHLDNIHIYDEWYKEKSDFMEIADASKKNGYLPIYADYSLKTITKGDLSLWEDFENLGLKMLTASKHDKKGSIRLINTRLSSRTIFIHNKCKMLIEQLNKYQWKRPNFATMEDVREEVLKKDDHSCDALQYLIRGLEGIPIPRDPTKTDESKMLRSMLNYKKEYY